MVIAGAHCLQRQPVAISCKTKSESRAAPRHPHLLRWWVRIVRSKQEVAT
jgi:hypothetical protein